MWDLFTTTDWIALAILGLALPTLGFLRALGWSRIGAVAGLASIVASVGVAQMTDLPKLIPLVVAGVSLVYTLAVMPATLQRRVVRLVTSRWIMVFGLVMGGWLAAGGWVAHVVDRTLQPGLDASQLLPSIPTMEGVDLPEPAFTDRGRSIRLLSYPPSDATDLQVLRQHEQGYAKLHEFALIRLAPPDRLCNCHGWVFTNGRYNLHSEDIDTILADNGYRTVAQPAPGDLVIYRDGLDRPTHTGIVRLVSGSLILIESKWGHLGVFLHPVENQPYGTDWTFMRTDRPNHLLRFSPPDMEDLQITPP